MKIRAFFWPRPRLPTDLVSRASRVSVFWAFALIFSLLLACKKENPPATTEASRPVVRIGWVPYSSSLPALVADERGIFRQHNINVSMKRIETSNECMQALARGDIDAIAGIGLASILAVESKTPGTVVMNWYAVEDGTHWVNAILVPPNSTAASLSDLKGKKIATFTGATQVANLKAIFSKALGAPDAIEIEQVAPNLQLQALGSGSVPALFTIEPEVSLAEARGIGRILVQNPRCNYILNPFPAGGGAVAKAFVIKYPEQMRDLTAALDEAIGQLRKDEVAAKTLLSSRLALDPQVAQKTRLYAWWTSQEVQVGDIQNVVDLFARDAIISTPVNPATFVYSAR